MASYSKAQRPDSFIRVRLAQVNAIGPGKADLLEKIGETDSLAEAARQLGMNYRRAWGLVKAMNAAFRGPLVETSKGGTNRGRTVLTPMGQDVLARYRRMEKRAEQAIAREIREFNDLVGAP
ncbi:MAG: LysR family transcriptional regulator [Rhodospirillales bacterium CG15_BIG_FIL_POST_REV_8_21_14_020_66_15]|nr:MAG: LysR family transcriptional regulator [Rhodospirillales bacterium CG15_BIG_FIL_POST_REV_8_21_14_020_66_15]